MRFERGPGGEGRLLVSAAPQIGIEVRQEARKLFVHFLDAGVDEERRLDVLDFATPVETIEARNRGGEAVLVVQTVVPFEYSARQSDGAFVLTVAPAGR